MNSALKRQPELRLIAEDLKQDYKKGLLNVNAYLYYLVRALRKNGWKLRIWNIPEFCEKWGIKVRSFYRAKSKLHTLGLLQEKISGVLELFIEDDSEETDKSGGNNATFVPVDNFATSGIDDVKSGIDDVKSGISTQLKPLQDKVSSVSTPLYSTPIQLNLSLPNKEREKFMKFAMSKVDQLPKRPQLAITWIEKNHDELWAEYQELEQRREANEQRARESIENQQETVVDPRIAADLENGKILQIDYHYKMFRDANGWWQEWYRYDEWKAKQQAADYQLTNEELLRDKQLIMEATGIKSS